MYDLCLPTGTQEGEHTKIYFLKNHSALDTEEYHGDKLLRADDCHRHIDLDIRGHHGGVPKFPQAGPTSSGLFMLSYEQETRIGHDGSRPRQGTHHPSRCYDRKLTHCPLFEAGLK